MKRETLFLVLIIFLAAFLRFFRLESSGYLAAFLGTLTVLTTDFLVKELFRKKTTRYPLPASSAFLLAISPWHFHLSRCFVRTSTKIFLITLTTFLLLRFVKGRKRSLFLFLILLLVSSWIFHGLDWLSLREWLPVYLEHFNLNSLFLTAGGGEGELVTDVGLLYLTELPFLLTGGYLLIKLKPSGWWFIIGWLLIAPLTASFHRGAPFIVRAANFLPLLQIVTSFGLVNFWQDMSRIKKLLFTLYCLLFTMSIFYFFHYYFVHLPLEGSGFWLN